MASGNGFITYSPDTRYGESSGLMSAGSARAYKFTCPGSGSIDISEIGAYLDGNASSVVHFRIYTHDSVNNCPDQYVANSDSGELSTNAADLIKINYEYGTKPQITGGDTYWLCLIMGVAGTYIDYNSGGSGDGLYKTGLTYPTFPVDDEWHTHTDSGFDTSLYAVYDSGVTPINVVVGDDIVNEYIEI